MKISSRESEDEAVEETRNLLDWLAVVGMDLSELLHSSMISRLS